MENGISKNRINTTKARKAAQHPDRPGENCKAASGQFIPKVHFGRCEGKFDCVEVCPYDVFEVRRMDDEDFAKLGFFEKNEKSCAWAKGCVYPACRSVQGMWVVRGRVSRKSNYSGGI